MDRDMVKYVLNEKNTDKMNNDYKVKAIVVPYSKHIKYFTTIIFLCITAYAFYYVINDIERYKSLLTLDSKLLIYLFALNITLPLFFGIINYLTFNSVGVNLNLEESIHLASFRSMGNQLPLSSGTFTIGYYLKQNYNLPFLIFFSITASIYILNFFTYGIIGFLSALSYQVYFNIQIDPILYFAYFIMMSFIFIIYLVKDLNYVKKIAFIDIILSIFQPLLKNKNVLSKIISFQIIIGLIFAIKFWFCFKLVSEDVNILLCLLISTMTSTARLFSITPGNIGVKEGIILSVSKLIGLDIGVTFLAISIDRTIQTLVIFLWGTYSSKSLLGKLKGAP